MSRTLRLSLPTPHPDIEHGRPRRPLEYLATLPDAGVGPGTGIILMIDGYGSTPDLPYGQVLRRYLACRYDCVAVGVYYFGARLKSIDHVRCRPDPDFFVNLKRLYNLEVAVPPGLDDDTLIRRIVGILGRAGLTTLDPECRLRHSYFEEYESFGLLPALDHLQVVHDLLARYPLDRRRLFAFGTSMGGYIALMLGKLAPNTFAMLVDNSGFVRAPDLSRAGFMVTRGKVGGVEVRSREDSPWTDDPASLHTYTDHHGLIRDLTVPDHWHRSPTFRCLYHSAEDALVPIADKEAYATVAAGHGPTVLHRIGSTEVDGLVFKTLEHGMKASLRHLFDRAWQERPESSPAAADARTDFCRQARHTFACGRHTYSLDFSLAGGPVMRLR